MRDRLSSVTLAVQEPPLHPHLQKMLMTKHVKVLARLGSRHNPSSRTRPNVLQPETVRQWNTLVPSDFELAPQWVNSYASGSQMLRLYSLKVTGLGGLEVVDYKHLCFHSNGKGKLIRKHWPACHICRRSETNA
jgi:hypothetical protein